MAMASWFRVHSVGPSLRVSGEEFRFCRYIVKCKRFRAYGSRCRADGLDAVIRDSDDII